MISVSSVRLPQSLGKFQSLHLFTYPHNDIVLPPVIDPPVSYTGVLFIARIETIVTAIQNNDLIVNAPMVRLSNGPPPIT